MQIPSRSASVHRQPSTLVVLQKIWGYTDFRPPQGEIVQTLLAGQDCLILMPTGGGKSICFQLPALLQDGLTLVVSPLVALMENQVQELGQRDPQLQRTIACLHSELPKQQRRDILWRLENRKLRLLYLSPETLLSPPVWERLCQPNLQINSLILDEAHCLSQWGDTFRPAYYRLGAVRPALLRHKPTGERIAIAAFTATADPQAQSTIQRILQLQEPEIFRLNPYRSNLYLTAQTVWTTRGRRQQLLRFIQSQSGQAGLVYVRTRRDSEELATWLSQAGYRTAAYHAGLGADERRPIETDWIHNKLQFVVCTCAFGMGINKPDVRWVVHFQPPLLLSEYVQEAGRAGRDGKPAIVLTLVSEPTGWLDPDDKVRWGYFQQQEQKQWEVARQLVKKLPLQGDVNSVAQQHRQGLIALSLLHGAGQLEWVDPFHYVIYQRTVATAFSQRTAVQNMRQFIETKECRWKFLIAAFGCSEEAALLGKGCGHCDRCQK